MMVTIAGLVCGIIGAITGVSSIIFNVINWWNTRRDLVVTAQIMVPVGDGNVGEENIYINIVNKSLRPVNVKYVGVSYENGVEGLVPPKYLPKMLLETGNACEILYIKEMIAEKEFNPLKTIVVYDNLGNKWDAPQEDVQKINEKIKKIRLHKINSESDEA